MKFIACKSFMFAGKLQVPGEPVVGAHGEQVTGRLQTVLPRQGFAALVEDDGTVVDGREISPRGTMRRSRWGDSPYGTGR